VGIAHYFQSLALALSWCSFVTVIGTLSASLVAPCSRYVHLAWALWERKAGRIDACMHLLQRGLEGNPTDAALYQVHAP
jgi:hypothetical protein